MNDRSYALCFWFGAFLVDRGTMTFPAVLKVFFAIVMSGTVSQWQQKITPIIRLHQKHASPQSGQKLNVLAVVSLFLLTTNTQYCVF